MTISDVTLITKKILIGLFLIIVPMLILFGGIKLSYKLLTPKQPATTSAETNFKNK